MDPLIKELFAFVVPLASLGAGAFYYHNGRKYTETKEARLAREAAEKAREAADKRRDDEIAHLKSCQSASDKQVEMFLKMHTESMARQDHQLTVFIQYAKEQALQNVEVAKLVERSQSQDRTLHNVDSSVKDLSKLVTDFIIRTNGKG